jgi:hypothetical protein
MVQICPGSPGLLRGVHFDWRSAVLTNKVDDMMRRSVSMHANWLRDSRGDTRPWVWGSEG